MSSSIVDAWTTENLGDIVDIETGKLDSNQADEKGQYPFFTCAPNPLRINEYAFDNEAILLAGNNADGIFHLNFYNGKFNAYQRTYVITAKNHDKLDLGYLFYYLQLSLNLMRSFSQGTSTKFLTMRLLNDLEIILPNIVMQREISKILSDLDGKIKVNQQMNTTLEAVGEAVFKRWFVDFEFPNQEGKPYKSSGGEMVCNEKFGKEIPKDWKVVGINEVALIVDCLHSKKPQRTETGSILLQVFNINKAGYLDLSDTFYVSEEDYKFWTRNIEVKSGDCVITNAGRVGAIAQIPEGCHFGIGRNMTAIRPNKISPTYLINYILSKYGTDEIQKNVDTGTVLDSLNVKGIIKIKILMPPQTILDQYENFAHPLRKHIEANNKQIFTLLEMREKLLPKLMSGKIRISIVKEMG
jgi:type I restriction enzyme, S subunit